jgi:hypothetical protein
LIGVWGLCVFCEVVLAIVAIEANVPDRGCQPLARPDGLRTQGLVVVRKSDRAARRSDRRSPVGPPYVALRGAADNRGSGGTSRIDTRLLSSFSATETTRAARRALPPKERYLLELTLIVGNGPAYTGMRLETVRVSSGLGLPLRSPPPVCYASRTSQARRQRASPF